MVPKKGGGQCIGFFIDFWTVVGGCGYGWLKVVIGYNGVNNFPLVASAKVDGGGWWEWAGGYLSYF